MKPQAVPETKPVLPSAGCCLCAASVSFEWEQRENLEKVWLI